MKTARIFTMTAALFLADAVSAFAQRNVHVPEPMPMKHDRASTNAPHWRTIQVRPVENTPKIHFYDKVNPVWWFKNADDPVPPSWYLPHDRFRTLKWSFRNPLHNFDHYVIGIADKEFSRSGRYPERNSNPNGGWDFEIARRKLVVLPFISYQRSWGTFYFGWREHGAFGIEFKITKTKDNSKSTTLKQLSSPQCLRNPNVTFLSQ